MKYLFLIVALASALAMCGGSRASARPERRHKLRRSQPQIPPQAKGRQPKAPWETIRKMPIKRMRCWKRRLKRWAGRLTSIFTIRRSRVATYTFYHGRPTSNGVFYWRFVELPDKERIELTPQRDVAYVYAADKGYEITYKGARDVEKKISTTTFATAGCH